MKRVVVKNSKGEKLKGLLYESKVKDKLLIICHGFSGSKDAPLMKSLANDLKSSNTCTFIFDFSGNGESEGIFGEAGLVKERKDLISVIKHFKDYKKVYLIGHSMGGAIVVITGNSSKRIKGVCAINPLVFPTISFKDSLLKFRTVLQVSKEEKGNFLKALHKRHNNSKIGFSKNFFKKAEKSFEKIVDRALLRDSFFEQAKKVDVTDYAEELRKPLLIIHGDNDDLIPVSHAQYLYNQAKNPKKIVLLKYAHHPSALIIKNIEKEIKNWLSTI